jgi:hypothetical protein
MTDFYLTCCVQVQQRGDAKALKRAAQSRGFKQCGSNNL